MGIGQKLAAAAEKVIPGTQKHEARERAEHERGLGGTYGETGATGTAGYGTEAGLAGAGAGAGYGTAGYGAEGETATERMTEQAAAEEAARTGQPAMAQTVTTAAAAPVQEQVVGGQAAVCNQEFYTKTEDRPVVTERKEYIKEHRPVEKEFVVETRATGVEREVVEGRQVEHLGTTERIVSEAVPKGPCE